MNKGIFKSVIAVAAAGLFTVALAQSASAQNVNTQGTNAQSVTTSSGAKVSWSKTVMDSTWNPTCCDKLKTKEVIAKYKPTVDSNRVVIGQCPKGLQRGEVETELGDWTTDVFFDYARHFLDTTGHKDTPLDFSILNFGGMRTEMPKGDVNSLDILSIYPFENYLVVEAIPGKYIEQLFDFLSKTNIQPMSRNVKFAVKNHQITECLINGEPLDPNKTYYVATINFLRDGGDNLVALKNGTNIIETKIKVMDIIISIIKDLTAQGKVIEKELDGRASWK